MTRAVRRPGLIIPILVTALLLELPVGGLWLFPLLLIAWREGSKRALGGLAGVWAVRLCIGMAMMLGGGSGGLEQELLRLVFVSITGMLFGALLIRGWSLSRAGAVVTVLAALLGALGVMALLSQEQSTLQSALEQGIVTPLDQALEGLKQEGDADLETQVQLESFQLFLKSHGEWVLYLFPSVLSAGLLLTVWLNVWVLKVFEPGFGGQEPLREWRPPEKLIWLLLGGVVLALTQLELPLAIGLNVLVLGATVFMISGVGVTGYAAWHFQLPQWLVLLLYVGLVLTGTLPLLAVVGLLDFQLDFRSMLSRAGKKAE